MRTIHLLCLLSFGLTLNAGCTTIARRTLAEAKGATSDASTVPGMGGHDFTRYSGVQIMPARSSLGGLVSSGFSAQLGAELEKALVRGEKASFKGGSPTLGVEPEIMWYHKGGIGAIMPERFAVVLYRLRADGGEVGRVQIVTKSGATRTGDDDLAESSAEELARHLRKLRGEREEPEKS